MTTQNPQWAGRPASTLAQKITAFCAVLLVLLGLGLGLSVAFAFVFAGALLKGLGDTFGSSGSQAVFQQAVCLTYTSYVLDRYDEGLTAKQITATIDFAATDRANGKIKPVDPSLRIDSQAACGSPADVLRAAGRKPR